MKALFSALAFILELVAFITFGYIGTLFNTSVALKIIIGILSFFIVIIFWGVYMAPRSKIRLKGISYSIAKFIIFGITATILLLLEKNLLAFVFLIFVIFDEIGLSIYK